MLKRRRRSRRDRNSSDPRNENHNLVLLSYEIVSDPIKSTLKRIPKPVQDAINDVHELLAIDPHSAVSRLVELRKQYPSVPVLGNLLGAAYDQVGDRASSRKVVEETYRNHPDYLFAKINYAQMCLMEGDPSKIPEIFEEKYDLKLLYPKRNQFHVTEYAGMTGVICAYYCMIGEREAAQRLYETLVEVDPDSPSVQFARLFLYPNWKGRLRMWLQRRLHKLDTQPIREEEHVTDAKDFKA